MKFKPKKRTVYLKCRAGKTYIFKDGVAKVSGMRLFGKPATMTLKEFKEINHD